MKKFSFSKKFKLSNYKNYNYLINDSKFTKFKLIKIIYKKNNLNYPRLGIILKKKMLKNPVIEIK